MIFTLIDMTRPGSFSALDKSNELMVDENDCKVQLQNFSQFIKNFGNKIYFASFISFFVFYFVLKIEYGHALSEEYHTELETNFKEVLGCFFNIYDKILTYNTKNTDLFILGDIEKKLITLLHTTQLIHLQPKMKFFSLLIQKLIVKMAL